LSVYQVYLKKYDNRSRTEYFTSFWEMANYRDPCSFICQAASTTDDQESAKGFSGLPS